MITSALADKLNAAADVIEERGHAHGHIEDARGRVCLLGAINAACGDSARIYTHDSMLVAGAVRAEVGSAGGLAEWNDAYKNGRFLHEKRDAVRLLRRVARKTAKA